MRLEGMPAHGPFASNGRPRHGDARSGLHSSVSKAHSIRPLFRLWTLRSALFLLAALISHPAAAVAQTSGNGREASVVGILSVGASAFVNDVWEDRGGSAGGVLRGGIRLPFLDVAALFEHWPEVEEFRISSAHAEMTYFPAGRRAVAPLLLLGVGYTRSSYLGSRPLFEELDGLSAAYGVGLEVALWRAAVGRAEAVLRTDDGGYNAGVRALVGWAPHPPGASSPLPDAGTAFRLSWMLPLSGPWRLVEPGYFVRFERPYHELLSGSLAFGVLHWQIPGEAFMRDYIWDTRAFVALPGVDWYPWTERLLSLRGGPAIIMMGEGPGNGVNLGAHLEVAVSRLRDLPVEIGVGWLWMRTPDGADTRVSGTDQNGLTIAGGIRF